MVHAATGGQATASFMLWVFFGIGCSIAIAEHDGSKDKQLKLAQLVSVGIFSLVILGTCAPSVKLLED